MQALQKGPKFGTWSQMGPKCQNGPKKVPILLSSPKFLILPSDDAEKGKHIEVTDRQSLLCPIWTYTMYHDDEDCVKKGLKDACSTADIFIHFQPPSSTFVHPLLCDLSVFGFQYLIHLKRLLFNKLAKLGDAIAISNLKLSITDPLTD